MFAFVFTPYASLQIAPGAPCCTGGDGGSLSQCDVHMAMTGLVSLLGSKT